VPERQRALGQREPELPGLASAAAAERTVQTTEPVRLFQEVWPD
jgi:hypothetical protein